MTGLTDSTTTLAELKARILAFARERDWEQFHAPKNLSMALAAEAGELMEHFLWSDPEASRAVARDSAKRGKIAEELADVVIYGNLPMWRGSTWPRSWKRRWRRTRKSIRWRRRAAAPTNIQSCKKRGAGEGFAFPQTEDGGSGFAAETREIVEIEKVGERANVIAGGRRGLDGFREPFVASGSARAVLFEPGRPGMDLGRAARRVGAYPGEQFAVGLAGFHLGEKRLVVDAGELEEDPVHRTVEIVGSVFARRRGARLVEQAREMGEAAKADPQAAGRMLGEIGCR